MKFIIEPQHGIKQSSVTIWGVCEFVDGKFETKDEAVIAKLIALGYEPEGENTIPAQDPENEEKALREKAKELGIKSWHVKSVETLTAEIAELEGA